MAFPNIYNPSEAEKIISRLDQLSPITQRRWGKMNVSQMLAHCCVSYEQAFGENTLAPNMMMRIIMKTFFKGTMTNEVPYKPNLPTAPAFVIVDQRDFQKERNRLSGYIRKMAALGESYFDGKHQLTLGKLNAKEWNNLMYKHIDHHLRQFGV